jgi:hypothetical protein
MPAVMASPNLAPQQPTRNRSPWDDDVPGMPDVGPCRPSRRTPHSLDIPTACRHLRSRRESRQLTLGLPAGFATAHPNVGLYRSIDAIAFQRWRNEIPVLSLMSTLRVNDRGLLGSGSRPEMAAIAVLLRMSPPPHPEILLKIELDRSKSGCCTAAIAVQSSE